MSILLKGKQRKKIRYCNCVSGGILSLQFKIEGGYMTIIVIYAPKQGQNENTSNFYETLQKILQNINKNNHVRSEVLTAVKMSIWVVTQCGLVGRYGAQKYNANTIDSND
jgi:hypothetical protein